MTPSRSLRGGALILALALTGMTERITVVEIDTRITDFIHDKIGILSLPIEVAEYNAAIAAYLAGQMKDKDAPKPFVIACSGGEKLRYGENPHQQGGLYAYAGDPPPFEVIHGKEMSYNNWLDLDGSWLSAQDFPDPTVAIIKHGNPCGLASGETTWVRAYATNSEGTG